MGVAPCGAQLLGQSPDTVQTGTTCLLIVNPFIFLANPFIAGWLLWWQEHLHSGDGVKVLPPAARRVTGREAVIIGMTSAAPMYVKEFAANTGTCCC